ncbi:MAG: choice-of-anchor R domain-containing protein [Candidatus Paceibacterota bacterium]
MKNTTGWLLLRGPIGLLIVLVFGLCLWTSTVHAQSVVAVSNIGQPHLTGVSVGLNGTTIFKEAVSFTTGSTDLSLVNVTIGIDGALSGATGFTLGLYGSFSGSGPADLVDTLVGPTAPTAAGYYTYTPSAPVEFQPNTQYVLAAFADTSPAVFFVKMTGSTTEDAGGSAGWSIGDDHWGGSQLGWGTNSGILQFSVTSTTVTAVPEPATSATWIGLIILGTMLFRRLRSRQTHSQPA